MNMLGPYELNQIITGDAKELSKAIPDDSVDLIFTDPVYDRIDDYRWLAETAARVLKPDRALFCFCGIGFLPQTLDALKECGLVYIWQAIIRKYGKIYHGNNGFISIYSNCLIFAKGDYTNHKKIGDLIDGLKFGRINRPIPKDDHQWGKSPDVVAHWVSAGSLKDQVIFDPFTGGGTVPAVCKQLNRHYLAFEIDPDTADLARQRVAETQPPLFVPENEQLELFIDNDNRD